MTVAERLKEARGALGLTQAEAVSKFGIPLGSLRKYEQGPSEPGSQALAGLAKAGINVNWLLTGDGKMLLADITEDGPIPIFVRRGEAGTSRATSLAAESVAQAYSVIGDVNSLLLQQVVEVFFDWMQENRDRVRLDRSRWGAVIAVLYKVAAKSGKAEKSELEQVLSIAA